MNYISHLVLYGLLAIAQARPEAGYNYDPPQITLNQNQLSSSFQQNLPQGNQLAGQAQQQLQLSQSQQSSSYQQSVPQLTAPAVQYGVPNLQNSQSSQVIPSLSISQSGQSIQQQNQFLAPNLQLSQSSFAQQSQAFPNFAAQPSINQVSTGLLQQPVTSQFNLQSPSLVTKHIYVHAAPEEPAPQPISIPAPLPPRKHYKIIFIKAPQSSVSQQSVIHLPAQQQQVEEKTLVYVLVDRPQQPEIIVPTVAPTVPSKPEVYFIKYKAQTGTGSGSGVTFNSNQGLQINSGESTSSLFSGGLTAPSSKYGVPGFQK